MQDSASFWTDIKNLEEQLAKSPDSYCFARLAEVYLKVGLVDDALHVARQGTTKHPGYLSGQRILSQACHARGYNEEALSALQMITEALPEDVASQKLLGRLYAEAGNTDGACRAFRTALEFAPDDVECRIELDSLERTAFADGQPSGDEEGDDDGIIDDLEMLEELDVLEDDQTEEEPPFPGDTFGSQPSDAPHHDPLSTGTLAELYVSQGFIHKALEIYRAILAENPADQMTAHRIAELETADASSAEPDQDADDSYEEEPVSVPDRKAQDDVPPDTDVFAIDSYQEEPVSEPVLQTQEDVSPDTDFSSDDSYPEETIIESDVSMQNESSFQVPEAYVAPEPERAPDSPILWAGTEESRNDMGTSHVPQTGTADTSVATLEGWLENIRRIKSCR